MLINSPTLSGVNESSVVTPDAGLVTLFNDKGSNSLYLKNSANVSRNVMTPHEFEAAYVWSFDTSTEAWVVVGTSSTLVWDAANGGGAVWTATATGTIAITSPAAGNTIEGNLYNKVRVEITRLVGSNILGSIQLTYTTAGHGIIAPYLKSVPYPTSLATVGNTDIIEFDMEDLGAGGNDWITNTILRLRLNLVTPNTINDAFRINWIAVGRHTPVISPRMVMVNGVPTGISLPASLSSNIPTPPTGRSTVFRDQTTGNLYLKKDSGVLVDLESTTGTVTAAESINLAMLQGAYSI